MNIKFSVAPIAPLSAAHLDAGRLSTGANPTHRYVVLDSLRGLSACLVVLMHCGFQGYLAQLSFIQNAFLFVDFFFVLSGFVIGASYGARLIGGFSLGHFMALRLARIYPLHLAVLMMFIAFELCIGVIPGLAQRGAFGDPYSLETLIQAILLIQIFAGPDISAWNLPSWSIAAEIWTYLIFAALLRWGARFTLPACIFVAILAPIFLAFQSDRYMNVVHDGALMRCMFGFALGIIGWRLAAWAMAIQWPRWMDHAAELGMAGAIILFVSLAGAGPLSLLAPFLFLAAVLLFAREQGIISRWLSRAPFLLVGGLSYSIYMIHTFLQFRVVNVFELAGALTGMSLLGVVGGHPHIVGNMLLGDAISLFFLALVILCAYASYQLIERPALQIGRNWIGHLTTRG